MSKLFGTDGVRGEANIFLTPELAFLLGKAAAKVLQERNNMINPAIVIGRDTRISGDMLEAALASGICSMGIDVHLLGVCPTPTVAYITKKYNYSAGIMISASHNPAADNGIKLFNSNGFKLADEVEEQIEHLIKHPESCSKRPAGDKVGRVFDAKNKTEEYKEYLLSLFSLDLSGKKVVVDCANGSASFIMPDLLSRYDCELVAINHTPDGININHNCGSTHLEAVKKAVLDHRADLGISHDGDSDRVLMVNKKGQEIDGDMIMAVIAEDLKKQDKLRNNLIVGTVMSNLGLKKYLAQRDINFFAAKVGDRYVLEEMLSQDAVIGGEQSGHLIFLEHNTTGDGILTALMILDIMARNKKDLEELLQDYIKYPQVLENAVVSSKNGWEDNAAICSIISEKKQSLGAHGRILVRASGTENLIRVMVEGPDVDEIVSIAIDIKNVVIGEMC